MIHVTDGVNVNQRSDAGDDHQHDGGKTVHRKIDADVQGSALNPGEVLLNVFGFNGTQREQRLHHPKEREQHRSDG